MNVCADFLIIYCRTVYSSQDDAIHTQRRFYSPHLDLSENIFLNQHRDVSLRKFQNQSRQQRRFMIKIIYQKFYIRILCELKKSKQYQLQKSIKLNKYWRRFYKNGMGGSKVLQRTITERMYVCLYICGHVCMYKLYGQRSRGQQTQTERQQKVYFLKLANGIAMYQSIAIKKSSYYMSNWRPNCNPKAVYQKFFPHLGNFFLHYRY